MAGPAIRCFELGRQLAKDFDVSVVSPCKVEAPPIQPLDSALRIGTGLSKKELYDWARKSDILFIQANVLKYLPALTRAGKYLIVDLYDPYLFSVMAQYADDQATFSSSYRMMHVVLEKHMLAADFSICASEKQRDYWLGRFCALGKLSPRICNMDSTLRHLIDVVPFGLPTGRPTHGKSVVRGIVPGIGKDDKLLLWSGGIWDWFDPLTVINAMDLIRDRRPDLKLYFMGLKSPNPQVPLMKMAKRAQALAKELGLLNRSVFFCQEWVKYEERANYLLEADAAVLAHFDTVETRFSFRTRMLDNFWTGLPTLTTEGDPLSDLIERRGAGLTLPYQNSAEWAKAIDKITFDEPLNARCRKAALDLANDFIWEKTAAPLLQYCRNPYHLPTYEKVTMPSLIERARSIYATGGNELLLRRSRELLAELFSK